MRPTDLKNKIFLDSGNPEETRQALALLGFLDGQTTNPTFIAKHPETRGRKFSQIELLDFYKHVAQEISSQIPGSSVSIEVYANHTTTAEEMLAQAREMFAWIPNAHIKLPLTTTGLQAAEMAVAEGLRVNMTLCFSQEQAAAVYAATKGAKKGDVLISPFVGRLDDRGENGMDLVKNIIETYKQGDGHVEVLAASVRNLGHLLYAIHLNADIVTAPLKILKEWASQGLSVPDVDFSYVPQNLARIPYHEVRLDKNWQEYNINHELSSAGLKKFADEWKGLII